MPLAGLRGARVLVTGGLGFIGSALANALAAEGARVTVLDALIPGLGGARENLVDPLGRMCVIEGDLRDRSAVRRAVAGQEVIFNLAAQTSHIDSMAHPQRDLALNCEAQLSLLAACRELAPRARVVFASTRQVYGRPRYLPVDEQHPLAPPDINAIHKLAAEQYHWLAAQLHGLRVTVLRLTNTYGPRMVVRSSHHGMVGWFVGQALRGETIALFGGGAGRRDFTYVDDVVAAFLLAAVNNAAVGACLNLGGEVASLAELADVVVRAAGSGRVESVPFPAERAAIDIGDYVGDWGRARTLLGWEPRVSLAEGLARTVAFYREHPERYR